MTKETSTYLTTETCMKCKTKETYTCDKRAVNIFDKKDLFLRQQGPTRVTKETYAYDKRDLYIWQERSVRSTKESVLRITKESLLVT